MADIARKALSAPSPAALAEKMGQESFNAALRSQPAPPTLADAAALDPRTVEACCRQIKTWGGTIADPIIKELRALIGQPSGNASKKVIRIIHDGFEGTMIGRYVTREGKPGVVLQQVGTRVVHVYGERWIEQ